jgi:hypothetical protein
VTNVLPRDRAEQILADHAAGKPVREIAEAYGHSITTVRTYVNRLRMPGEPAARADDFAPFVAYCRRRLADDPHLRTPALLAELSCLGLDNSRATLYRAMERHGIQTHPCSGCYPASMSGYSPLAATRAPQPAPLPVPAAPVAGETLASFLSRLAAVNRTTREALLDVLPPWFRVKTRWHDDRWQPPSLVSRADDAAARLAVISGSTTAAIKAALPAFGGKRGRPLRAVIACRLCTAARGIQQPVPVHLPAHQQLCIRHGIWLPGPETPQFSVRGCPDILDAERRARRLLRQCTIEQLVNSTVQKPGETGEQSWKRRAAALIESNPRSAAESSPQEMFLAAAYPDAIAAAQARSKRFREQSSLTETILADH